MPTKQITTRQALARNLAALMKRRNVKQGALAKQSGVSQRTISDILNEKVEVGIEKVDKLAAVFELKGWQLQLPDVPEDLLDSDLLGQVMQSLASASKEGRDLIAKNAAREAFFSPSKNEET